MANPFVHIELNTGDVSAAKAFYRKLFDWKLKDESMGPGKTYTLLDAGQQPGGGMMLKPMPEAPTQWLPYVAVADVKKTISKAAQAGARVVVPYMEVGEYGSMGVFIDPTGAALAVWKANMKPAPARKAKKKANNKKAKKK